MFSRKLKSCITQGRTNFQKRNFFADHFRIRFDLTQFDSIRFDLTQFDSNRFDSIRIRFRFGQFGFNSIRTESNFINSDSICRSQIQIICGTLLTWYTIIADYITQHLPQLLLLPFTNHYHTKGTNFNGHMTSPFTVKFLLGALSKNYIPPKTSNQSCTATGFHWTFRITFTQLNTIIIRSSYNA